MRFTLLLVVILSPFYTFCQSPLYSMDGDYSRQILDRMDVSGDTSTFFTSFKPLQRDEIAGAISLSNTNSTADRFNAQYMGQETWEYQDSLDYRSKKPFWKKLYRSKSDFYHYKGKDLDFHLNPILAYQIGNDTDSDQVLYRNTRGLEVRGTIDEKLSFYTVFTENQLRYPAYVREFQENNEVIPRLGFWKLLGDNAYDFIQARGHISFNATKHINLQVGHDRFFIGNGYRSLLLSDFSNFYPYVKIRTKIWKLQYTNLYTQLIADAISSPTGTLGTSLFPKKFMTTHHLSINFSKNFNLGLFESIIFSRQDSVGNNSFEFNYLNPIILYRSVEQYTGSPDNALLGIDFKYNALNRLSFYGQFLIDEFLVDQVINERGDWRNKFAFQLGGKYFNAFGVDNLDIQLEHNFARPFTYTHESIYTNYAHYDQPLAHPLGANFRETIGIIRYQPFNRLYIVGKVISSEHGRDQPGENNGGNVLLDYGNRTPTDTDNFVGQGVNVQLIHADLRLSYQLKHNLFIDATQVIRNRKSDDPLLEGNTAITSVGFRLNIARTDLVF